MPAGDAGLDLQRTFERNVARTLALGERDMTELRAKVDRLQAQLVDLSADLERITADAQHWSDVARAQRAVVDAARWVITEARRAEHAQCGKSCIWRGLIDALAALDKAQAAQPEGEPR